MGLNKDSILFNLRFVISVVEWILVWVIWFPFTVKGAAQKINKMDGRIFHFYKPLPNSLSLSASLSWSMWAKSTSGDLLGTDSGVFMSSDTDDIVPQESTRSYKFKETRRTEKKKDYPPAIPSLALPPPLGSLSVQEPCYLSRHYCDGRLIIRQEILKSYEYFESIREDGRSILNLKRFEMDNDENLEEQEDLDQILSAGKDKGIIEFYYPLILDGALQNGSTLNLASSMPRSTFIDGINTCVDMHGNTVTQVRA